jgi:superkiller protein 3
LYREALRAYGLPPGEGPPAAAAARIRGRPAPVRQALVAALDEWVRLAASPKVRITEPHLDWLKAVVEATEPPEGWTREFWTASAEKDEAKRRLALERLAEAAAVGKLPAQALTRLAKELLDAQAAASAVQLLRRARLQYPGDFWVNQQLGEALLQVSPPELAEAVRYYTAAVALRPDSPGVHNNLGLALYRKGQLDEAITCLKRAVALDPKYAMAHNNLALALHRKGQVDKAIACYRKTIELDPKYAAAHNNLGSALWAKGQLDKAIASYRKAIELDPKVAVAHDNLGRVLAAKGQVDEAIACFRNALEFDPKNAAAHNTLGWALQAKGQVDEAIACYKKAIALDPKFVLAHTNLGALLCDSKRDYDGAIVCFRNALQLNPKSALYHRNLGNALYHKGQLDAAIACFKMAIALNPKYAEAHVNLADVLANAAVPKLRDPVQAVALAKKATELDPKFWMGWANLGEAYYRTGQWQEAITALNKGLALLKSDNGEVFFFLAMAHHRADHKDKAKKWYDKGIAWMDKHAPKDAALRRYRSEAASVLGVK